MADRAPRPFRAEDRLRLDQARSEYEQIAGSLELSLDELLGSSGTPISVSCGSPRTNPHADAAQRMVEEFAHSYGIWLEREGPQYNTMNAVLYPAAEVERLAAAGKSYAVSYYLNDTMGREKFGHLTPRDQELAADLRRQLVRTCSTLTPEAGTGPIGAAMVEMLNGIAERSGPAWFARFRAMWRRHLDPMMTDGNAETLRIVRGVDEYIDFRVAAAGMEYAVILGEFANNSFTNWDEFDRWGVGVEARRLFDLCATTGPLMNDLFSFEKEFVDYGSDSNLVTMVMLNDPTVSLVGAIETAAHRVRDLFHKGVRLIARLRSRHRAAVSSFVDAMEPLLLGSWTWQAGTARYQRSLSIFRENHRNRETIPGSPGA